ncbi:MAG TPA: DUF5666 domain-containing protein, partial [Steroidobacteraceae bacterium]
IQVDVNYLTRFEDHGLQRLATFKLANIQVGDWLEVRGAASTSNSGSVTAMRIDRRQPQPTVQLMGPVDSAARPDFVILTTNVTTTYSTQFNSGLTVDRFFTALVGKIANVAGYWDGTTLTATQVSLGDDDDGGDNSGPGNGNRDGDGGGGGGGGPGPGDGGGGGGSGGGGGPGPG